MNEIDLDTCGCFSIFSVKFVVMWIIGGSLLFAAYLYEHGLVCGEIIVSGIGAAIITLALLYKKVI